jgi:hypothetical protein
VGCAIILLLQQSDLLPKPTQRLAAITLLHDLYRGESMAVNPFATVFIHLLVSTICLLRKTVTGFNNFLILLDLVIAQSFKL